MILATRATPLDHVIEAHPVWTGVVLLASMVLVGKVVQWKNKRDLQPLCDELGFTFVPGMLFCVVSGTIAGRDARVTLTCKRVRRRSVDRYVVIAIQSKSDAGVRFGAQRCPKFLRRWAGVAPIDGVELHAAPTGCADFDKRWVVEMDQIWCAPDIFDEEVRWTLDEASRGFGRGNVSLRYDGTTVRLTIPRHKWRNDATAIRCALEAAVLVDCQLQGDRDALA